MKNRIDFIERLKAQLKKELPGQEAQFTMAPVGREKFAEISKLDLNPKKSAVLILLYHFEDVFHTVLIERSIYEGVHSGQMAFPGGRHEDQDESLEHTALRETFEEIGIPISEIEIVGKLSDVYIIPSNYMVTPFIGILNGEPSFDLDSSEVQSAIKISLNDLRHENAKGKKEIVQSNGLKIRTPCYEIEGFTIWGATAMMISELNAVLDEIIFV